MRISVCSKRAHETNEDAQKELVHLLYQGVRLEELRIYFCSIHQAYHVGGANKHLTDPLPRKKTVRRRRRLKGGVLA